MAEREPVRFVLFGLEWARAPFVSYREWSEWYDEDRSLDGLMGFFEDPPRAEFEAQTDVAEFGDRLLELWLAIRTPPGPDDLEGNG